MKRQVKRSDTQDEDNPVDNDSTLFKFAKQKFGVELSCDVFDEDNSFSRKPSGKGSFKRRGNTKLILDCYGVDIAPMNIFENQVIPVGIHNL